MLPPPPLLACVDANTDIAFLVGEVLLDAGFDVVTYSPPMGAGARTVIDFLQRVAPAAAIYSIGPPYPERWQEFQHVRTAVAGCPFVLTTTDQRRLDALIGPTTTLATIGKPFDLDDLMAAVRRQLLLPAGDITSARVRARSS